MRYVAAYLLASMGGSDNPSLADVKKVLGSVGIDCDDEKANKVISSLKGKNLEELIEAGKEKLASVPSGGAVAAVAAGAAGGPADAAPEAKKEEKKEESEDEDDDMGLGLFD